MIFDKKDTLRFTPGVIIKLILSVVINILIKYLADILNLPFRFDTVGTVFAACTMGPLAGVLVSCVSSTYFGLLNVMAIPYAITGIVVAVCAGIFYPKKYEAFRVAFTGALIAAFSMLISTPLNLMFYNGLTGNSWGDALFELLADNGIHYYITSFVSEAFVDFPDRIITLFIVTVYIYFREKLVKAIEKQEVNGGEKK